jgi:hypothetical protein
MKDMFRHIAAVFLIFIFVGPQFYKTVHIFTDHHGHLRCEAMKKNQGGLNAKNDHCLLCGFHFAIFDQTEQLRLSSFQLTIPLNFSFHKTSGKYSQPAYHYLLRAPPHFLAFLN